METMVMSNVSRWHWMNEAGKEADSPGDAAMSPDWGQPMENSPWPWRWKLRVWVTNHNELHGFDNTDICEKQFGTSCNLFRRPVGMERAFEPRWQRQCPSVTRNGGAPPLLCSDGPATSHAAPGDRGPRVPKAPKKASQHPREWCLKTSN